MQYTKNLEMEYTDDLPHAHKYKFERDLPKAFVPDYKSWWNLSVTLRPSAIASIGGALIG